MSCLLFKFPDSEWKMDLMITGNISHKSRSQHVFNAFVALFLLAEGSIIQCYILGQGNFNLL